MSSDDWEFNWRTVDETRPHQATTPHEQDAGPALNVGDVFAGYYINEVLGQGGMGIVFRATDPEAARDVALKVLHERASPTQLARLRREGELTAALDHPGIVRVHAGGDVNGLPYLAYALVPNARPLDAAWEDLDREARVRLVRDTARAVGHAHEHEIVHRDLKAENVLVDASGTPHVVDFGLARHIDQERLTQTGAMVGTPLGMAPEQFLANHEDIGPPTDVFSLGILLYRALTDELPFLASGWVELARMVTTGNITPLRDHDPTVPAGLETICLRCLAVEPQDRYPDAATLAADLDAALEGRPLSSASSWARARQLARRPLRNLLALGTVALLILSVGLYLGSLWQIGRRESTFRQLVTNLDPEDAEQRRVLAERLAAAEDLPLGARAAAELALAGGSSPDLTGWRARLEHARRAADLDPTRAAAAARREAACLLALELPAAALEPLERARAAAPGDDALRGSQAEALHLAGRDADALELLEGAPPALKPLRARVLFALGRHADARALAASSARERPSVEAEVLIAELERGRSDAVGRLHQLVRVHPDHLVPRAALARAYLHLGAAGLAAGVLRGGPPALASAAHLLSCAASGDPQRVVDATAQAIGWRRPTLRFLLHAARRSLGWRALARHAKHRERFTRGSKVRLEQARALLDPAWKPELESLRALEQRLAERLPPLPNPARLTQANTVFEVVRERQRNDASPGDLAGAYANVFRAYPTFQKAQFYVGKSLLAQGRKRDGLRKCLAAALREPALNRFLHSDIHRVYDGQRYMRRGTLDTSLQVVDSLDRLRIAYEHVLRLEHENKRTRALAALLLLDRVLEDDPSNRLSRSLRGFVLLRLGRAEQAEWDLTQASAAAPLCALTAFYRLLVWTDQKRPVKALRTELRRITGLGFVTWNQRNWKPQRYPELKPLLGRPEFQALFGESEPR